MAIILLQTHKQIPRYCTDTDQQAHTHVDKHRSTCLPACGANTPCACARGTYLHTLIENRQTYSPTWRINTIGFLAWNLRPHTWKYACYPISTVIINGTLPRAVKKKKKLFSFQTFEYPNSTAAGAWSSKCHSESLHMKNSCVSNHACAPIRYQEIYPKT